MSKPRQATKQELMDMAHATSIEGREAWEYLVQKMSQKQRAKYNDELMVVARCFLVIELLLRSDDE
ncbi:hypothetical protein [Mariprofundus ferrooxydans]|uniref:hypothetical protein n=1 Tax=Mariprofundus ferrooxydans TaxID=314344 RepID=UPI0003730748|nr:hypothetical protein [Mariprofundus ferrooxydans]